MSGVPGDRRRRIEDATVDVVGLAVAVVGVLAAAIGVQEQDVVEHPRPAHAEKRTRAQVVVASLELAPLHMPLNDRERVFVFPDLPEATYRRLPAMLADALVAPCAEDVPADGDPVTYLFSWDEATDIVASEIKRAAREEGMVFLREAAVEKVIQGLTTLKEINKATFVD